MDQNYFDKQERINLNKYARASRGEGIPAFIFFKQFNRIT